MSKIILKPGIPPLTHPAFRVWLKQWHWDNNRQPGQRPPTQAEEDILLAWIAEQKPLTQ